MGHGLSELQKTILKMAYHNRTFEERTSEDGGADLYHYEVLIAYWKLPGIIYRDTSGKRSSVGWQHLNPATSTHAQFNTTRAALSRAARRLEDRRFVVCISSAQARWAGVNLTPNGIAMAKRLPATS